MLPDSNDAFVVNFNFESDCIPLPLPNAISLFGIGGNTDGADPLIKTLPCK